MADRPGARRASARVSESATKIVPNRRHHVTGFRLTNPYRRKLVNQIADKLIALETFALARKWLSDELAKEGSPLSESGITKIMTDGRKRAAKYEGGEGVVTLWERRQEQIARLEHLQAAAFADKKWGDCVRIEHLRAQISGTLQPVQLEVKAQPDVFAAWTAEQMEFLATTGKAPEGLKIPEELAIDTDGETVGEEPTEESEESEDEDLR